MDLLTLYWIVLAIMIVGVIGAIIPGLPGSSFILAAILIWSIATKFAGIGFPLILIFIVLILSAVVEYVALYLGVKQVGASKWAQFGAIAGMVLGFFWFFTCLTFWRTFIWRACRCNYWRICWRIFVSY